MITLVIAEIGQLVAASPDGTEATQAYALPQGQELCRRDVYWLGTGKTNVDATGRVFNRKNVNFETGSSWL